MGFLVSCVYEGESLTGLQIKASQREFYQMTQNPNISSYINPSMTIYVNGLFQKPIWLCSDEQFAFQTSGNSKLSMPMDSQETPKFHDQKHFPHSHLLYKRAKGKYVNEI